MSAIVELRKLCLAFGALQVFDGLDLEIEDGEIITILGGSGSGKSVLLKTILRLVRWQSGAVVVDGEDISAYSEDDMLPVRRKVGMVFQHGALYDSITVHDNIAFPLRERRLLDETHISERVAEVLEMVGLPGSERKMPAQLSGGMRKRVALARAIAEPPRILLYDEPTTGLDPINVRRISELIIELNQQLGVTSIVVSHDLASAYMVSNRLAMIGDRRVIAVETAAELRRNEQPAVQAFLSAMNQSEG